MNFFNIHHICIGLFSLLIGTSAYAQRTQKVDFYYVVNDQIQSGSFNIEFKFYKNDVYDVFPKYIDYGQHQYNTLKIKAVVSDLKWSSFTHSSLFKLAFGNDINTPHKGIGKVTADNVYLYSGAGSKEFVYNLKYVNVATYTGIAIGFKVLLENVTYPEAIASTATGKEIIGSGEVSEGILIIPDTPNFKDRKKELENRALIQQGQFDDINTKHLEKSYSYAERLIDPNSDKAVLKTEMASKPSLKQFNSKIAITEDVDRSVVAADEDYRAFTDAMLSNTISSYRNYLNEFPDGRYATNVENRIVGLTPFKIDVDTEIDGVFKVHEIRFVDGVGKKRPIATISDNGDHAIKKAWEGYKKLIVKVPEGRETKVKIRLGRKSTSLELKHEEGVYPEEENNIIKNEELEQPSEYDVNNKEAPESIEDKEEEVEPKNKTLLAFLLSIPFLTAIVYLLYRKHQL